MAFDNKITIVIVIDMITVVVVLTTMIIVTKLSS